MQLVGNNCLTEDTGAGESKCCDQQAKFSIAFQQSNFIANINTIQELKSHFIRALNMKDATF